MAFLMKKRLKDQKLSSEENLKIFFSAGRIYLNLKIQE